MVILIYSLVPNLKIGSDVRVGPSPDEIAARRVSSQTQKSAEFDGYVSIGTVPNFRGSMDMGTPSRHGHTRAYSSSIDLSKSPDFSAAMVSTPHAGMRQRNKHGRTPSLPTDATRSEAEHSVDDAQHAFVAGGGEGLGIDLPPIPASYLLRAGHHLSAVTEQEEGNESSLMRETMDDMRGAILAFSSPARPPQLQEECHDVYESSDYKGLAIDTSLLPDTTLNRSIRSEEELMAEEMERVMGMDSPAREEFVISPPPSSYASSIGGGRESRASMRSSTYSEYEPTPPVPVVDPHSSAFQTPRNHTTAPYQFQDAEEHLEPAVEVSPAITELRESPYSHSLPRTQSVPFGLATAHPHPPPVQPQRSMPNIARAGPSGPVNEAHPPVRVREELRALRKSRSTDTIASDTTSTTTTTEASPMRPAEEFKPSRQELLRIARLKERKAEAKAQANCAAAEQRAQPQPRAQALRSVEVQRNVNGIHSEAGAEGKDKGKLKSVLKDTSAPGGIVGVLPAPPKARLSKSSTGGGSGKENTRVIVRGSKTSSNGSVVRPLTLRA